MRMCRRMQTGADEFLTVATEGVVNCVYKVVTWSSFSVTLRQKVTRGKCVFHHCVTALHTDIRW